MSLTALESLYLEKRAKMTRHWRWVGSAMMVFLVALAVWMWITVPYLVNPWAVSAGLESGALADSTISIMAAMLPIVMLSFLTFGAAAIVLAFVAFSNERRLIQIIWRLSPFNSPG